jgi:molybdenum cofactor cytidylyltransferase
VLKGAGLSDAVAVLGHQASEIADALEATGIRTVENPDFATGIASSLKAGIHALPDNVDGALILLADMPEIAVADLKRLTGVFSDHAGMAIVRATASGQRGNPVILPRALFGDIEALQGDTGARHIVENSELEIVDVEIGEAARVDVDTPDALAAAGGVIDD